MKNSISILMILSLMFVFTSCDPETKMYNEIKERYVAFEKTTGSYDALLAEKNKIEADIDSFLQKYPGSEYKIELKSFKKSLPDILYPKVVYDASFKYSQFTNTTFYTYKEYKRKLKELINFIHRIQTDFPNKNSSKLSKIYGKLKNLNDNILIEEREYNNIKANYLTRYTNADADREISRIKKFLNTFPNSIKYKELIDRIWKLEYVKFKNDAKSSPQTIAELNSLIDKLKRYPDKIDPNCSYCHKEIEDKIKYFESQRNKIFEIEYQNKKTDLLAQMENYATGKAYDTHDICGFASDEFRVLKDVRNYGRKMIFDYTYIFKMKGGFLCTARYQTRVKVKGVLEGNPNSGVSYYVDQAYLAMNTKMR